MWSDSIVGAGCAGLLVPATPTLSRVSQIMPLILQKEDHGRWLDGSAGLLSLSPPPGDDEIFLEESDESWSTGSTDNDNS
jgi:putative SOS response-associated peptidase YedK